MPDALDFRMKTLAGPEADLAAYRGKVVLMVNVASECGFTPQYRGLENLHERYAPKGLRILGFPSNDFGRQEPGTDEQIRAFCQTNYGVGFDMFSKVAVRGDEKTPLYAWLTSPETNPASPGEVEWNFEKFLIGRDGKIAGRFPSKVDPESPELVDAIEAALKG
jgi:glutathione peroxidase